MRAILAVAVLAFTTTVPSFGAAVYYSYNLAALGLANADADLDPTMSGWYGFHGGQNYQQGLFSVNLAAKTSDPALMSNPLLQNVSFYIGQGAGNESWSGTEATISSGVQNPTLSISTNAANAQVVFLMISTFWGSPSASADIVLTFAGGGQQTFTLYGDSDIRDHNDAPWRAQQQGMFPPFYWTNQVDSNLHDGKATFNETTCYFNEQAGPGCAATPGGDVNGLQADWLGYRDVVGLFIDPAYAGQTLTGIFVKDLGNFPDDPSVPNRNLDGSKLWIWGVTVGSDNLVPEPSTFALLAGGIGLLGFARFRRKAA